MAKNRYENFANRIMKGCIFTVRLKLTKIPNQFRENSEMSVTNLVAYTNIILYLFNGDSFIADLLNDRQVYLMTTEIKIINI